MKRTMLFLIAMLVLTGALSAQTVLIAKEDTRYKKQLVETLTDRLEADGITVVVIDHQDDELAAVDPADYDAVFVTNSGAQARVRPQVTAWLGSIGGNDANVVVHTTKRTSWDEGLDVDALSSASKMSNLDEIVDDIIARLKAKF